jgi:hypothetical protein
MSTLVTVRQPNHELSFGARRSRERAKRQQKFDNEARHNRDKLVGIGPI